MMPKHLRMEAEGLLNDILPSVLALACMDGDICGLLDRTLAAMASNYLKYRDADRKNIRPQTLDRYRAELAEAGKLLRGRAMDLYFDTRKKLRVALIEYQMLSQKVTAAMKARGIPFRFSTQGTKNVLTIQVVGEYFMEIPLSVENCDRVLDLIRYYISRPDCARMEIPQMRFVKNMMMARHWGNPDC